MKKILLSLTLLFVSAVTFAQQQTILANFDKIKFGHGIAYGDAMEKFTTKFLPASEDGGQTIFDIVGGKHHGEKLRMRNKPVSFAERDVPRKWAEGQIDSWFANVVPHIESTNAEMMVYLPEYSSTKYEEGKDVEKFLMTEWTIVNQSKAGDDIRKRLVKVSEKLGIKTAVFSSYTGENKVYSSRRLANGWKELDEPMVLGATYDELYGKGAWDKDQPVLNNYWKRTDRFMLTKNIRLSSK